MKRFITSLMLGMTLLGAQQVNAEVADIQVGGWFEGGYVTWTKVAGYSYNVYVSPASGDSWTKLDTELVREYSTYGRADAVGLKAGEYKFKVVPVQNSTEVTADATETSAFTATAYDRGGFAHFKTASSTFNPANGVGAYKNDGTLKAGAKVFYVTADNAKTITTTVKTGSKDTNITTCTGLQAIIDAYQKGYDTTPLDFRIIGTIKADNMDSFSSSAEGLQIKGKGAYSEMNITIEGIGKDAAIHGFGFLIRNAASVELRNFAIMWCMDDAVSMDTDNSNLWVHNLDLFYGQKGSAADQAKGDGTLDIKGDSKYSTLSYNHLWDNGKTSLCGMKSESGPNYLTYHHNWFDHSDSRHPRIRTMSVHIYNNYYDGNSKYGVGSTTGSDVFVENNYFRNCKYPMLTSLQGSDVHNGVGSSDDTKGTFSGETGGSIKAYGNYMTGQQSFEPYKEGDATYSKHFDAYVVENKADQVPSTVVSVSGSNTYSNFDTDASLMYSDYKLDAAADVPGIVTGSLGAGRCQHGDFSWTFGANEDNNAEVITALSSAIQNYQSTLVGFFGQTISNGGAQEEQGGSSNEGTEGGSIGEDAGDDDSGSTTTTEEVYIGGETTSDYFLFNEDNQAQVKAYLADGTITFSDSTSTFKPDYSYDAVAAGKSFSSTVYTGSLQLAKASSAGATDGGSVIFRCKKGITSLKMYMYRTGSIYYNLYTSTDSTNWTKVRKAEKVNAGIYEVSYTTEVRDTTHCIFLKLENTSTGGLNLQGIRILTLSGAKEMEKTDPTVVPDPVTPDPDPTTPEEGEGDKDASALYKFTVKGTVSASTTGEGTIHYSDPIETQGGTFVYGNVEKIASSTVAASGYAVKMDGDASETSTKYVLCNLNNALKLGDKITLGCYSSSSPKNNYGLSIYADMSASALASVYNTQKNVEEALTVDVTESMVGLNKFYICRNTSSSAYFTYVIVTGTATGIFNVTPTVAKSAQKYAADGTKIASPRKGQLYIENGKKHIAK